MMDRPAASALSSGRRGVVHKIEYTLALRRSVRRSRKRQSDNLARARLNPALPRITRLMALAIKLDGLMRGPETIKRTDIAQLGRVSRSRITQILNLLLLAPDLQERLLFLAPAGKGREPICEKKIRQLAYEYDWELQRSKFERLFGPGRE